MNPGDLFRHRSSTGFSWIVFVVAVDNINKRLYVIFVNEMNWYTNMNLFERTYQKVEV